MTAELLLRVAGAGLRLRGEGGLALEPPGFQYAPFLARGPVSRPVDVGVGIAGPGDLPGGELVFDTGDGWGLWQRAGQRIAEMPAGRSAQERPLWQVAWTPPLTRARARVSPALIDGARVRHLVHYPFDQILLTEALLPHGSVLVHAAGAATPFGGIAFAGVSGAGKSTVTRLLGPRPGHRFLSDDRLFLEPGTGGVTAHGTPWCGDAGVAEAASTPLAALCFLEQGVRPALVPLAPRDALGRLLPLASLPWYDRARIGAALEVCAALVEALPCHRLVFRPDAGELEATLAGLADAA